MIPVNQMKKIKFNVYVSLSSVFRNTWYSWKSFFRSNFADTIPIGNLSINRNITGISRYYVFRFVSIYRSEKTRCLPSMKMISWHPGINQLHLPASWELQAETRGNRLLKIICPFPFTGPSLDSLPFISLTPSSLPPVVISAVLSFASSLLSSQSDAYTLLRGFYGT